MNTNKLFVVFIVGLMLFGEGLFAQDSKNMTLLGNYGKGEGESKGIFAAGAVAPANSSNSVPFHKYHLPFSFFTSG